MKNAHDQPDACGSQLTHFIHHNCMAALPRTCKASSAGCRPKLQGAIYDGAPQKVLPSAYDNFTAAAEALPIMVAIPESLPGQSMARGGDQGVEAPRRRADRRRHGVRPSKSPIPTAMPAQQISQIRAFIDKKCTIITSIPGSATALNDAVDAARAAGIPFVTAAGSVSSPYAINVDSNYAAWGYDMIKAIAKETGGKADILMVEGIAGHPIVVQERGGADRALKEEPGIKVVRSVNGNWTANVTKTVVLQALATYPGKIDAVWTTGSESRVIAEAFAQAGRPAAADHGINHRRRARLLEGASGQIPVYRSRRAAALDGGNAVPRRRARARRREAQTQHVDDADSRHHAGRLRQSLQALHDAGCGVGLPDSGARSGSGKHPRRLFRRAGAD